MKNVAIFTTGLCGQNNYLLNQPLGIVVVAL
jgi:hypothetical protein